MPRTGASGTVLLNKIPQKDDELGMDKYKSFLAFPSFLFFFSLSPFFLFFLFFGGNSISNETGVLYFRA